mmetsp:Transcript_18655/g.37960  ORF Transcript_18655/g.37960 Transcript_18655/m.37960 type:complete len:190 (+) Transcript_18655:44-613(+)
MFVVALAGDAFVAPTGLAARVEGRTADVSCMMGRRQIATSAALLAFGACTGPVHASSIAEQRAQFGVELPRKADQSKIGVSTVPLPAQSSTNAEKARSGPLDTSGYTEAGKCETPLSCWAKYPGKNLREGTCGINKKCPPAVKTTGETLSPFGINEGLGESYTNQGSKTRAPPPPPAPEPAPAAEPEAK